MFETDNLFEFFKNMPSSVCILMVIPIVMFTAPAACSHEFPVFRVQQFDLNGVKYGKIVLTYLRSPPKSTVLLTITKMAETSQTSCLWQTGS